MKQQESVLEEKLKKMLGLQDKFVAERKAREDADKRLAEIQKKYDESKKHYYEIKNKLQDQ